MPGCSARIFLPAAVVSDGDATTEAPYTFMTLRRKGFCSYETLTIYTLTGISKYTPAMASAVPH